MLIGKKDIGIRMNTRKKLVSVLGIVLVLVALGVYGIAFSGKKGKELSIYNNEKTYNYRGFEKTLEREKNDVRKSIDKSEFRGTRKKGGTVLERQ